MTNETEQEMLTTEPQVLYTKQELLYGQVVTVKVYAAKEQAEYSKHLIQTNNKGEINE